MTAEAVLQRVHEAGLSIQVRAGNLHVTPKAHLGSDLREALRAGKAEVIDLLRVKAEAALATAAADAGLNLDQIVEAAGADYQEILEDPGVARAFLCAVRDRLGTQAGRRPRSWTKAVLCRSCGPVWLFADSPDVVEGCPWCHLGPEARLAMPRPQVACGNCEHFQPDLLGAGGIGCCALEGHAHLWSSARGEPSSATLSAPPLYPWALRRCGCWSPRVGAATSRTGAAR